MKFFAFYNKNLSSNICPQTKCSTQFWSLAFKNCAASIEKYYFFSKKAKNPKNISEKKSSNIRKICQIGDGHWSLGRFLYKNHS
jgi:hypothetical protein